MKKLVNLIFLLFLCPLVMGAYVGSNQTLNLTSDQFGVHGPVTLGLKYSDVFGPYLTGVFTQSFLQNNAVSVGAEVGKKQYRFSGTYARALTSHQRVKVTAERLAQKATYDFNSGSTDQWIGQNAYGLTYQYLIAKSLLKDINVNTFYSRAIGKNLSSINFVQSGTRFRNLRHIAGGTDKSASVGVDLLPLKTTLVGTQLNYDDVTYHGRYENLHHYNNSGLGATISLDQLLTHRVKFKLLASDRQTGNDYQAEIDWLLRTVPGSQLTLALTGERILGKSGMQNDTQTGINLDYTFGGSALGHPATFGDFSNSDSLGDLAAWAGAPAVHMDQVLAVTDQKNINLGSAPTPEKIQQQMTLNNDYSITVAPGQPLDIDVSQYFSQDKNAKSEKYTAKGLPQELQLKGDELVGKFKKKEVGAYVVMLSNTQSSKADMMNLQGTKFDEIQNNQQHVTLKVSVKDNLVPYPETQNKPNDVTYNVGKNKKVNLSFLGLYFPNDSQYADGLFYDPVYAVGGTSFSVVGLSGSDLHFSYTRKPVSYDGTTVWEYYLTIVGTLPKSSAGSVFHVSIAAANRLGSAAETQDFLIKVNGSSTPPSISPADQTLTPTVNQPYNNGSSATTTFTAMAGSGTFVNSNLNTEVAIANESDLADFGLTATRNFISSKEIDVSISSPDVKITDDKLTEAFNVTATNEEGKTGAGKFTVSVLNPDLYKYCPAPEGLTINDDGYVQGTSVDGIDYGPSINKPTNQDDTFYFNYAGLNINSQYSHKLLCHYVAKTPDGKVDGDYYLPSKTQFSDKFHFKDFPGSKTCGNLLGPSIGVDVCKVNEA